MSHSQSHEQSSGDQIDALAYRAAVEINRIALQMGVSIDSLTGEEEWVVKEIGLFEQNNNILLETDQVLTRLRKLDAP